MCGQSLQQQGDSAVEADVVGQCNQMRQFCRHQLGIRERDVGERDALADAKTAACIVGMQRRDLARRFVACDPRWRSRQMVTALPSIDVGEIKTNRTGAHDCNTR